jgi:hypothetical protein
MSTIVLIQSKGEARADSRVLAEQLGVKLKDTLARHGRLQGKKRASAVVGWLIGAMTSQACISTSPT